MKKGRFYFWSVSISCIFSSPVTMPGSKIAEAVTNSPLSEEEVQMVMEKLLEKQNEEWEAVSY